MSIQNRNIEMLRLLIDSGANVNNRTGQMTPLGAAISSRRLDYVKLLVDAGAETDNVNQLGASAVKFAKLISAPHDIQVFLQNLNLST